MAQNNIEAYQGSLAESWQANNVLKLDIETLGQQNDKLLNQLDSVREELKIVESFFNTLTDNRKLLDWFMKEKGLTKPAKTRK